MILKIGDNYIDSNYIEIIEGGWNGGSNIIFVSGAVVHSKLDPETIARAINYDNDVREIK